MCAGARFKAARKRAGVTTITIAAKVGCTPSTISHMEAGRRTPGLQLAAKLEELSASWPGGPIRAVEWVAGSEAA